MAGWLIQAHLQNGWLTQVHLDNGWLTVLTWTVAG